MTISPTRTLSTSTFSTVPFGRFTFSILILRRRLPSASRRNSASPRGVAPLRLAPTSLISILASNPCPGEGEGLGDAVGLGEGLGDGLGEGLGEGLGVAVGLGDGLAVGLGLGVAVGLGLGVGVGVCQALTCEELKTNRVRRSMTPAAPARNSTDYILLFRKPLGLSSRLEKIAPSMRLL